MGGHLSTCENNKNILLPSRFEKQELQTGSFSALCKVMCACVSNIHEDIYYSCKTPTHMSLSHDEKFI